VVGATAASAELLSAHASPAIVIDSPTTLVGNPILPRRLLFDASFFFDMEVSDGEELDAHTIP
jgi:hypothetical protein